MNDIFAMNRADLQAFLVERGIKKFRADQILHYIYKQNVFSWHEMTLLPQGDRETLAGELPICCLLYTSPSPRDTR